MKKYTEFCKKFKTSYQTSSSSLLSQVVRSWDILPCCFRQLLQITETIFFWLPHISRFTYYLYNLSRYLRVHSLLISNERKTQTLKQSKIRHRRKDGLYIPEPIGTFTWYRLNISSKTFLFTRRGFFRDFFSPLWIGYEHLGGSCWKCVESSYLCFGQIVIFSVSSLDRL